MHSPQAITWIRRTALLILALLVAASETTAAALVSDAAASRFGLERAWFTQAPIDAARSRVVGAALSDTTLCVLSDACVLEAFDTTTGVTRWSTRLGDPGRITVGPTMADGLVALSNGATLFMLDAATGRIVLERALRGAPGAAPAIVSQSAESDEEDTSASSRRTIYVYVPLITGRIESVSIVQDSLGAWGKPRLTSWNYQSDGPIYDRPIVASDRVVWATGKGRLYGAYANGLGAAYRFSIADRILAPAATTGDKVIVACDSGVVYGLDAERGGQLWRKSIGAEATRPAVISEGVAYVGARGPSLHALDADTGQYKWRLDGVDEFLASTDTAVYCGGPGGVLTKADLTTGEAHTLRLNLTDTARLPNPDSGSIFLISKSGLVQCLREPTEAGEAMDGGLDAEAPEDAAADAEEEPMAEDDPFAAEPVEDEDPFAVESSDEPESPEEEPMDSGADDEAEAEPADDSDPFADPFADF